VTDDQIREVVLDALRQTAPEVDIASLDPARDLRRQADLDSVDLLNLIVKIHEALQIDVPEQDYGKLNTLDAAVAYLSTRLEGSR
jgi:acyl carrier protein